MFNRQLSDRLHLARTLALPCYQDSDEVDARQQLKLENQKEQQLISVVASLTDRSLNLAAMFAEQQIPDGQDKVRTLESIAFRERSSTTP